MLDLVILRLPDQELFSAATGRHVLDAHMDALPQNPVANLHAMHMPWAFLQTTLTIPNQQPVSRTSPGTAGEALTSAGM